MRRPLEVGEHKDVQQLGAGAESTRSPPTLALDHYRELQDPHLRGQLIDCDEDASGGARRDAAGETDR
jgi:hypothetical protein